MADQPKGLEKLADPPNVPVLAPRWAVIGIFLILLVFIMAYARQFMMPVTLGLLLALVFTPVRRTLDRLLPSPVSALLIVGALIALLIAMGLVLAQPAANLIDDAPRIAFQLERKIAELRGAAQEIVAAGDRLGALAQTEDTTPEVVVRDPSPVATLLAEAPAVAAQVAFVLAFVFFLLSTGDMFLEKVAKVLPTFRNKRQAVEIAHAIEAKLSRYLFTITVINAALGATIGLAMAVQGLPNPLLFAVAAFALNYVPYLGALTGTAAAGIVALVTLPTVPDAAIAAASYFAITTLFGQFVTPFFVSRQLRLNTVVVFLAVALFAWLWSAVGMLIATPLLVTIRVFCDQIPNLRPIGTFLSARGAETPEANDTLEGPML
ncbi:MAG: AI-2E family transporter [Pseudomonadota bacterium]